MTYAILPLTNDPRQAFTTGVMPDGAPFRAQISVRRLPAARGRRRSPPGGWGGGGDISSCRRLPVSGSSVSSWAGPVPRTTCRTLRS